MRTLVSLLKGPQPLDQMRADVGAVGLPPLLVEGPEHGEPAGRTHRVPPEGVELDLLGHHLGDLGGRHHCPQGKAVPNPLPGTNKAREQDFTHEFPEILIVLNHHEKFSKV